MDTQFINKVLSVNGHTHLFRILSRDASALPEPMCGSHGHDLTTVILPDVYVSPTWMLHHLLAVAW